MREPLRCHIASPTRSVGNELFGQACGPSLASALVVGHSARMRIDRTDLKAAFSFSSTMHRHLQATATTQDTTAPAGGETGCA